MKLDYNINSYINLKVTFRDNSAAQPQIELLQIYIIYRIQIKISPILDKLRLPVEEYLLGLARLGVPAVQQHISCKAFKLLRLFFKFSGFPDISSKVFLILLNSPNLITQQCFRRAIYIKQFIFFFVLLKCRVIRTVKKRTLYKKLCFFFKS